MDWWISIADDCRKHGEQYEIEPFRIAPLEIRRSTLGFVGIVTMSPLSRESREPSSDNRSELP